jgi:hypothetical protein
MRCSEIIPLVLFVILSYMPLFELQGNYKEFVSVATSVHTFYFWKQWTGLDWIYSYIGVLHKNLSGEFDFGLYLSGDTFYETHIGLFILLSQNRPIMNVHSFKTLRFYGCVTIQIEAVWVMTPRRRVHRHRRLGGTCCLHISRENECSKFLRNSIHLQTTRGHISEDLNMNVWAYHHLYHWDPKLWIWNMFIVMRMQRDITGRNVCLNAVSHLYYCCFSNKSLYFYP